MQGNVICEACPEGEGTGGATGAQACQLSGAPVGGCARAAGAVDNLRQQRPIRAVELWALLGLGGQRLRGGPTAVRYCLL